MMIIASPAPEGVATFPWWDDAVTLANQLTRDLRMRHQVVASTTTPGRWVVRPAPGPAPVPPAPAEPRLTLVSEVCS